MTVFWWENCDDHWIYNRLLVACLLWKTVGSNPGGSCKINASPVVPLTLDSHEPYYPHINHGKTRCPVSLAVHTLVACPPTPTLMSRPALLYTKNPCPSLVLATIIRVVVKSLRRENNNRHTCFRSHHWYLSIRRKIKETILQWTDIVI